jgi:hypothetical protein
MARIIILILIHAFADFFLQGSKLSRLKIEKLPYLFEHVGIYVLTFVVSSPLLLGLKPLQGLVFSLVNGVLHFVVDFISGKLKTRYANINDYKYLLVLGLDHTAHLVILILTYVFLFPHAMYSSYGLSFN